MTKLTWEEVVARRELIGGDLESVEDSVVYRGRIKSIRLVGDQVIFESDWTAIRDGSGQWRKWHINRLSVEKNCSAPQDIGAGRIYFNLFWLGHAAIFPKGGNSFDSTKVKGLV